MVKKSSKKITKQFNSGKRPTKNLDIFTTHSDTNDFAEIIFQRTVQNILGANSRCFFVQKVYFISDLIIV